MKDRRLLRIKIFILVITVTLTLIALLLDIEQIDFVGVAIGGLLAFVYFLLLTIFLVKAFSGIGNQAIDLKVAGKLGLKLLLITLGPAILTIAVILTKLCQPIGFLIGFSALFGSIAFETMADLVFSKPRDEIKSEN
ncbi:MAG: hypothetical protein J7L57_01565 [Deltaproteobacteria bacterium]|nr:hypothetical protein [Candidatus Tharpella sp.]